MFIRLNQALDASRARREEGEKGFTLIELLVVVLIIGVLSAIAIPIFLNQQKGAKISAVENDLGNVKTAIVSKMVTDSTFAVSAATDLTALEGYTASDNVILSVVAAPTGSTFCIKGVYTGVSGSDRSISDKGGVKKNGTCA